MTISTHQQPPTVIIGGGSGFIGRFLTSRLRQQGWRVLVISRSQNKGDLTWADIEQNGLPACDAVINLAGKHILDMRKRWNQRYIDELYASRLHTTQTLVESMNKAEQPPKVFISVSGKCFYGTSQNKQFIENASAGEDFPGQLCAHWEAAAQQIDTSKVRHVHVRVGIVLGPARDKLNNTGILPALRLPFRFGLGAKFGTGKQYFPWVHINDVTGLMIKAIRDSSMHGTYNAVSPGIVQHEQFMNELSRVMKRPVWFRIPESVIRLIVTKDRMPILTQGQYVVPQRTLEAGYQFEFPSLSAAMNDLFNVNYHGELNYVSHH